MSKSTSPKLKKGWTTGACATAATKASYNALVTGNFLDPVKITLPKGQTPEFVLTSQSLKSDSASAGIIKDAGDDPDVTHQALIVSQVEFGPPESGVSFQAGPGVGIITKPGLPLAVGEPAINPVPRKMMHTLIEELAKTHASPRDVLITISVPGGEELALKTWNPRLGIRGGISILGTTGIVIPYSCSAWIHSIHRGIDVARASGLQHVAGCTGSTSEEAVRERYHLPEEALLDMGDFVGGLLKYLCRHPLPQLTLGGGFGKFCKLAQGHFDLHSGRSQVDFVWLSEAVATMTPDPNIPNLVQNANSALEVLEMTQARQIPLPNHIAELAQKQVKKLLKTAQVDVEILIINRQGKTMGHAPFADPP